jgi:hypothetical protein
MSTKEPDHWDVRFMGCGISVPAAHDWIWQRQLKNVIHSLLEGNASPSSAFAPLTKNRSTNRSATVRGQALGPGSLALHPNAIVVKTAKEVLEAFRLLNLFPIQGNAEWRRSLDAFSISPRFTTLKSVNL